MKIVDAQGKGFWELTFDVIHDIWTDGSGIFSGKVSIPPPPAVDKVIKDLKTLTILSIVAVAAYYTIKYTKAGK